MALLIFNLCYLVYRKMTIGSGSIELKLPTLKRLIIFCCFMGLITFLVRQWYPLGSHVFGFQLGYFPMYTMQFVAGILAAKNHWLRQLTPRYVIPWLMVSLVCIVTITIFIPYILNHKILSLVLGGFNGYAFALAMWESFACVGLMISCLSLFHTYANGSNRFTQSLAKSAYTVFVFQEFFIILITLMLVSAHCTGLVGWLLSCLITIPFAFIVCYCIRKIPYVEKVL